MTDTALVLATLNARWIHSALGLRSLQANLGDLAARTVIEEAPADEAPDAVAQRILSHGPRVVGLGVYLWNAAPLTQVARALRARAPGVRLVLGGPEVSYPPDLPDIAALADVVIAGEAEQALGPVCEALLRGEKVPPVVQAAPPELGGLRQPDALYDSQDVAHRVIYVESSRGCPYRCAFCLSANAPRVRRFARRDVLSALDRLHARGVRRFKFVDRALHLGWGEALLEWLLSKNAQADARATERRRSHGAAREEDAGGGGNTISPDPVFAHLELVPDHLPDRLRPLLRRFPPGTLQLEAGVQTFTPEVAARIGRAQDYDRLRDTLRFLREETHVHVHADLVVGLPGETLGEIGAGFDALHALGPQEIQVGLLKRLRGAPLTALEAPWALRFDPVPPYSVRSTAALSAETVSRLRAFSLLWDRLANRGHLPTALPLLWRGGRESAHLPRATQDSDRLRDGPGKQRGARAPFAAFLGFSDWIVARTGRAHSLSLKVLTEELFSHLTGPAGRAPDAAGPALVADYCRVPRKDLPQCLRPWADAAPTPTPETSGQTGTTPGTSGQTGTTPATPPRQRRRLDATSGPESAPASLKEQ
jgi:radical SAM superfamily enzyme YgiQ (UPF0313 family)